MKVQCGVRPSTAFCSTFIIPIEVFHIEVVRRDKIRRKFKIAHIYNVRRSYVMNNERVFSDLCKC
jgi:hypothetical protein